MNNPFPIQISQPARSVFPADVGLPPFPQRLPEVAAQRPPQVPGNVPSGQSGLNAYQLAVLGAPGVPPFTGTMAEWILSLEGGIGPQGDPGVRGIRGLPGPPGAAGDTTYEHSQLTASDAWTVAHNLSRHPSVTVVDSAGNVVVGRVVYISPNQLRLTFSSAFSGVAYLN